MSAIEGLILGVAALLWTVAAYRVSVVLRAPAAAPQRALAATFACLAVTASAFHPAAHDWVSSALSMPNVSDLLARVFLVAAACSAQLFLLLTVDPGAARQRGLPRVLAAVAAVALLLCLFAAAPLERPMLHVTTAEGGTPLVASYLLVSALHLGLALADVMTGAWRHSRAARPVLRTSLLLVTVGCALGQVYVATKCVVLVALGVGVPVDTEPEATLARGSAALGGLVVTAGAVTPALARVGRNLRECARMWWRLHRLYPLWAATITESPGIALEPPRPRWREALRLRDLHFRLYRRVIELEDGQLALRGATAPEPTTPEVGLPAPGSFTPSHVLTSHEAFDNQLRKWLSAAHGRPAPTAAPTVAMHVREGRRR